MKRRSNSFCWVECPFARRKGGAVYRVPGFADQPGRQAHPLRGKEIFVIRPNIVEVSVESTAITNRSDDYLGNRKYCKQVPHIIG